ncbi:flagellar protein FlgN [Candidatus Aerophobetes bacterium]|nr:flagellar protein FlgN [Candidatus Aerophobetes bacterium]
MVEKLRKLIQVIKKEVRLYEKLYKLCREEENIVIKGDLNRLEDIIKEEESIFLQIRNWEKVRGRLMDSSRESLSLPQEITLSQFAEIVDEPYASELSKLQKQISSLLEQINKFNKSNISLIEYSIRIIDDYFRLLAGVENIPVYASNGKVEGERQKRKLLDQRT